VHCPLPFYTYHDILSPPNRNFAFLDHIHQEFTKYYKPRRIQSANAYAMEKKFMPILRSATHYHNVNAAKIGQDKHVQTAQGKVEDMKVVMGRNLNLLMERGENIDALASKSEFLREDASVFKRKSLRMRNKMRRKWMCMTAILAAIVLVLIYLVVVGFCGVELHYCLSSSNNSAAAANDDGGGYNGGGNDDGYNGGEEGGN
jgi:vesicle-associated membrane protein 7